MLNLVNELVEVDGDRVEEVVQRAVNFSHLLIYPTDTLLELLPYHLLLIFVVSPTHHHLTRLEVTLRLRVQLQCIVGRLLIARLKVGVLVLHDAIFEGRVVAIARIVAYFSENGGVFREHLVHEEVFGERKSFDFTRGHMHKLRLGIVGEVVVAEE